MLERQCLLPLRHIWPLVFSTVITLVQPSRIVEWTLISGLGLGATRSLGTLPRPLAVVPPGAILLRVWVLKLGRVAFP